MQLNNNPISHLFKIRWLITIILICLFNLLGFINVQAHPMPNTVALMDLKDKKVSLELQLPLSELELAFGHDVNRNSDKLIERLGPQLKAYLLQHIHPLTPNLVPWTVMVDDMQVQLVQDSPSGPYKELTVHLSLIPPGGASTHKFTFNYDVIIHQVVSHFALVSVRQDWDNGLSADHPYQIGVIRLDVKNNRILPLEVNIQEGNIWKGFKNMVSLGMDHIKEGTDHLLFLLTLLLPAPLIAFHKRWAKAGNIKYSLLRILKIVTAFTIGHSITLIIGATGLIHFPGQPIEILIAVSILVSALHALKPIFPGKEMYIAAGFGLIHGMAFAETLVNLNLDAGRTALSILGFNLGIELMQLLVIAITIPWLIILSRTGIYAIVRVTGAVFAGVAAIAWIVERGTQNPNFISTFITQAAQHTKWVILLFAILAVLSMLTKNRSSYSNAKEWQ